MSLVILSLIKSVSLVNLGIDTMPSNLHCNNVKKILHVNANIQTISKRFCRDLRTGEIFWGQNCCTLFHTQNEEKSTKIYQTLRDGVFINIACVYAYARANFLWLFLILSVEEGTTVLTPKKITVFPGTQKVGPFCPTFIRGDPYEPHRPPEKVTFSDH